MKLRSEYAKNYKKLGTLHEDDTAAMAYEAEMEGYELKVEQLKKKTLASVQVWLRSLFEQGSSTAKNLRLLFHQLNQLTVFKQRAQLLRHQAEDAKAEAKSALDHSIGTFLATHNTKRRDSQLAIDEENLSYKAKMKLAKQNMGNILETVLKVLTTNVK